MHTRTVRADELTLFVEAGGVPDHRREVEQYLESMFAAGSMRPEWCFVAEDGDRLLGRVAFWTLPGTEEPFALVLLDVPWDGDYMGVGTRLLADVFEEARALGAEEIEHVVDDPPMRPQFQHYPEQRSELLESVGFAFRRETGRFEWRGKGPPAVPSRLSFCTLEEVGEDAFVEAMRIVSEGTLDREIQGERERLGAERAARVLRRRPKGRARTLLVAARLYTGGRARRPGDAGGSAGLPDHLLRRRRSRDERTGVRRRLARRRHHDTPRGQKE
jgi:GNAT superfamily N-acetyltransferase